MFTFIVSIIFVLAIINYNIKMNKNKVLFANAHIDKDLLKNAILTHTYYIRTIELIDNARYECNYTYNFNKCINNEIFYLTFTKIYKYHEAIKYLLLYIAQNEEDFLTFEVDNIQLTFETINLEQFKIKVINDNNIFEYEYRGDVSKVQKFFNRALFY